MKNALLYLALLGGLPATALAQTPARPAPTAAELKKNLALVAGCIDGESDATDNLISKTAHQLLTYLKTHEVTATAAKNMGLGYLDSKDAAHLKVFSYTYSSGGTRGDITNNVFQWKNPAGQLFVYAAHEEGGLNEIYKLASPGRTQYLLLGTEQGSSICMRGLAWLVELKGDYLLLDDKAFDNKPTVDICNVKATYDARRQTLTMAGDSDWGTPDVYAAHLGHPFKPFTLYFSQGRFVRKK
ncbi:MAG: hypothetical protein ACRYFZ_28420 [Janthinobacterium lividum]